jgi:nitroimidazol reductase NimA-like FMN-containing flavoprotein (pyridoxamine 5'-phosphate oxidase superfamily)
MKRYEKEIADPAALDAVLERATVCRLGLVCTGGPYVVPMIFAYELSYLFLHSASEGMKIECLREDPSICFEVEEGVERVPAARACAFSMRYRSVVGFGRASFVEM